MEISENDFDTESIVATVSQERVCVLGIALVETIRRLQATPAEWLLASELITQRLQENIIAKAVEEMNKRGR